MKGQQSVSHESRIVHCSGPDDPHALHGISTIARSGELDVRCTGCAGHGQWNREIDLVSQRSKRHICDACDGRGWIETGDDPVSSHNIEMSADGYPKWVTRLDPPDTIV
jgi:DnaJ-class molecular chaperone